MSKYLFGVFTFFQKTNENKLTSSKVDFVHSFFGRNVGLKKSFRICLTFSCGASRALKIFRTSKLEFFQTCMKQYDLWICDDFRITFEYWLLDKFWILPSRQLLNDFQMTCIWLSYSFSFSSYFNCSGHMIKVHSFNNILCGNVF